ncbi:hypothetical protein BDQ17DRAFT_1358047, partial [Cyathus striatus]
MRNPDDRIAKGERRYEIGVQPHTRQVPTSSKDIDRVPVLQSPARTIYSSHPLIPSSACAILSLRSSTNI